jgi:starch synthase
MRDLPPAVARRGFRVSVVTPSYGTLHRLDGARLLGTVSAAFRGGAEPFGVYSIDSGTVQYVVLDHPMFAPGEPGRIYHDDGAERPFATDANVFAGFGAAAAAWVRTLSPRPDAVHLNDWHAAFYLLQRDFAKDAESLRGIRTVFSIHNLAYQGQRPLAGDDSSLERWFPDFEVDRAIIADPHAADCINPMAFAIRSADAVNTVSPTYAQEICRPSDPERGFFGGEGLEGDLAAIAREKRLFGILNGCEYLEANLPRPGWQHIVSLLRDQADAWLLCEPERDTHRIARERIANLPKRRPVHLLTSIGRLVRQKSSLMFEPVSDAPTALDAILDNLRDLGVLILIGSGEDVLERKLTEVALRQPNLVFMNGYSETLAEPLYRAGDLFLMPSSFEPCGISQMLAMRDGQPCVVNGVGGLCDTVRDGETGFVFHGSTPREQAEAFVRTVDGALELRAEQPLRWASIAEHARSERFDWDTAARHYIEQLYEPDRV